MPNVFCLCGYANEYSFSEPNFCGKCGKPLKNNVASARPRRQQEVSLDEEVLERRARKLKSRDEDDEDSNELDGIDLDNIKLSISATSNNNRFILDDAFIKSGQPGYVPPARRGFEGDIMEDFKSRSNTKYINGPPMDE